MGWCRSKTTADIARILKLLKEDPSLTRNQLIARGYTAGAVARARKIMKESHD